MTPLLHFLQHWTGSDNGSGWIYLEWSGFIGDLTIFAACAHYFRVNTCHARPAPHGCYRRARHVTKDGYHLCKKCVARPASELNLHDIHEDHK